MTSRIIRPVERSQMSFPASTSTTIFLARRINVAAYKEVTAYFRVHPGSVVSPNPSTSNFNINADGYTDEDPGANDGASPASPAFQTLLVATDVKAMAAGAMKVIAVPQFGSLLSLSWAVTTGAGALSYIISCDLVCKEF